MSLNGDYEPKDEDTLYDSSENTLTELDEDAATGHGTMNRALLQTLARLLAENQEVSLDNLYDAAYIETASGEQLERRCHDIGIYRKEAVPATGVVEFYRNSEPVADFTIQTGTLVQPTGSDVPTYETTETTSIGLLDGYEDGSLDNGYQGDTGSVTVVDGSDSGDPTPNDGSYELEVGATSDVLVYHSGESVADGDTIRFSLYLQSNTILDSLFHVTDADNHYRVTTNADGDVFSISKVDGGSPSQLDSSSVTVPGGEWLTVEIDTGVNTDTKAVLYDSSDSDLASVSTSDDTYDSGHIGVRSADSNDTKFVDHINTVATAANVEATQGGEHTNVGPRSITELITGVTGIDAVRNPRAIGDTDIHDTSGNSLVIGVDREDDEELRDRALKSTSIGGATTVPAVATALRQLDDVISVKIFENDTLNDNTGSGGLPPVSIECVVYGGTESEIGQTLFDVTAPTERLYSGAHGTSISVTIESDVLDEDETVEWSDPPRQSVDFTIDLVHDDTYVGDDDIKDIIVDYVGGTKTDGSTIPGTGIGEDVRIDAIRDRLVGDDTGVLGLSSVSTTPATSTSANGLTIVDVNDDEVAETDATDGSISLTTTEV